MIWGFDQYGDYQIKSGGGSEADSVYISHFKTTIADPKTGNDKDVVILKKFSTEFQDVLVYIDEIQELQDMTEPQKVRDSRRKDNLRGIISVLTKHESGYPTTSNKKISPQKWIDELYKDLVDEYTTEEINEFLDKLIDKIKEDMVRPISKIDKEGKELPVDMKDKDISSEEMKLKSIQKIKMKI